jgi:hypothetical protein
MITTFFYFLLLALIKVRYDHKKSSHLLPMKTFSRIKVIIQAFLNISCQEARNERKSGHLL